MNDSKKNSTWGIWATVITLGAIALGGAYIYYRIILGRALNPTDAAKLVPENALLATYVVTEPRVWAKMSEFGTAEAQEIVSKTWQELGGNITNISNINYEQDLKPWLGNIMFAVLPKTANQTEDNILMVVGITNKAKALQFALKVKQNLQDLEETEYKNFPISQGSNEENEPVSFALVNDYLIISSEVENLNKAIDSFNGETSFATEMEQKNLFDRPLGLKQPLAQIYLPNYARLVEEGLTIVEQENTEDSEKIPAEIVKELPQIESALIGIGLENEGLHFQVVANLNPDFKLDHLKPSQNKILEQFPQETFLLFSGQGLSQFWSDTVKQIEEIPEFKTSLDELRNNMKKEFNLDLDRDILGWMNGEIGFGLINSNQGALGVLGIGGVLGIETSDRATAEKTITQLTNYYQKELTPFILSSQKDINKIKVTEWKSAMQDYILGYGWSKSDIFLMSLGTPFENLLTLTNNKSLAKSKNFQQITQNLPQENIGYFYLDLELARNTIQKGEQMSGQTIPTEARAFLYSLKGIASTVSLPEDLIIQSDLMISLEKNKQ